jgi:hypothetical protein
MGKIMRIALTSALLLVAAMAFADEPSAPETSTEAAAQATSDRAAAQPAAAETTAKVAEDDSKVAEDNRPFKPPSGYRPKRINGELVYCSKKTILGSQFPVTDCRNEAQLREMVRTNRGMREDLNRNRACAGSSCSAN